MIEIILFLIIPKYLSDFNDNRDMKTFNKTFIVPLFITFILTGCMPDSLTKFKKDPPKKPTTSTTVSSGPVLDETGNVIPFDESTYFSFVDQDNNPVLAKVSEVKTLS